MKSDVGGSSKRPELGGPIQPCGTRSHAARGTDPSALQALKNARRNSRRHSEVVGADSDVCHLAFLADRQRRNERTETQPPAPKHVNRPINSHGGQPPDMITFEIARSIAVGTIAVCELDVGTMKPLLDSGPPLRNGVKEVCGSRLAKHTGNFIIREPVE